MAIMHSLPRLSPRKFGAIQPDLRAAVASARRRLHAWRRRQTDRAALRQLLERADDRMLGDISLTRAALADEAGRPFWQE